MSIWKKSSKPLNLPACHLARPGSVALRAYPYFLLYHKSLSPGRSSFLLLYVFFFGVFLSLFPKNESFAHSNTHTPIATNPHIFSSIATSLYRGRFLEKKGKKVFYPKKGKLFSLISDLLLLARTQINVEPGVFGSYNLAQFRSSKFELFLSLHLGFKNIAFTVRI